MCRAPASPKKQSVEDDKQTARVHGERIHCDLVGPTRPSINDEVYAMITHDDATGYLAARALRTKQASEAAAAFDDMYGNQSVSSVRTDNGGEFQSEFAAKLKERKIRHERSLPRRPQTNSRAERFHRTVAEGMACLFVASGVPYAFWTFCLMAFLFVYARSPGAGGVESPYQLRFNRSYDLSKLRPFGSACYYLSEEHEKFASRGRLGVVLGYSRLQSYYVLDFEHYVETKGEARIVHTRDVRFPPQLRWPFHELGMDNPDAAHWAQRFFEPEVLQQTPVAGDDGRCMLCGLRATDAEVHCRGCLLGGGRRRHVDGPGCLRARCGGHSFPDVQHNFFFFFPHLFPAAVGVRGLHTGGLSPNAYGLLRPERQSARPRCFGEVEHTVELRARKLARVRGRGPRASERRAAHSLLHRYSQSRPPPSRPGGGGCGSQCRRGPLGSHARRVSHKLLCCFVPAPAYLGAEHEERASGAELWVGGSLAPLCDPQHGTIVLHGAGLWLARSGQRRHKGRVAAQGSSHRRCAVDDQVKTAPVVWRNAGSSGGAEPLLRDHLAICPNGFARNSHPRPFDDLGSPSQEPSARAGQGMVAEDVDEPPHPGEGPHRFKRRGSGRRRRRRNASCMACGDSVVAGSAGMAVNQAPACGPA